MIAFPLFRLPNGLEMRCNIGLYLICRALMLRLDVVDFAHYPLERGRVALKDEVFLGFDIIVQACFRESQGGSHIRQGGRSSAFTIEQSGSFRQYGVALRRMLRRFIKRRPMW